MPFFIVIAMKTSNLTHIELFHCRYSYQKNRLSFYISQFPFTNAIIFILFYLFYLFIFIPDAATVGSGLLTGVA
jgi:hypothetical protein